MSSFSTLQVDACQRIATTLLDELLGGPPGSAAFILNRGDGGLLKAIDALSAVHASAPAPHGGPSIAAHVDHLAYGFELMGAWADGADPFASADYAASWRVQRVDEEAWAALRARLRAAAEQWRAALQRPRSMNDVELAGVLASVAHLAYHLGAMRQVQPALKGPRERD